ncbi:MAG: GLPGLI family protein [Flavobacteriales bacterium]
MKILFASVLWVFSILTGFSQGTIRYTESLKMEVKMDIPPEMADSPEMKAIMDQMNKASVSERVLYFDAKQCVYREYEDPSKKATKGGPNGDHMDFYMMVIKEDVISYHNLTTHILTESRDIFDKTFIVTDTAKKVKWKITAEVDTIAGYRCMKATYMKDTVLVQAWFSTDLKASIGPDNLYGLPGAILKLDVDEGRRIVEATSVDLKVPDSENLKAPKKGKKVTRKEYDAILRKKLQEKAELEGDDGNGTTIRIDMH